MEEKKDVLEEIEWKLKGVWTEYQKAQKDDKEKAKMLLAEYQRLQRVYKRQKMIMNEY